ncbi:DMT family transporter [Cryobacterium tagatosivorans]|uniref:DMT family transporter n=1 Tax=Cryobacterium tagatosivorans TaxID=1259199 RepID=UPI00141A8E8A|nr:EamA family transporter [Cryobacterium tagatosivorans]
MNRGRGVAPILVAAVLWGTTGTAAHFLPDSVSPLATGAATMAVGGALLFALTSRGAVRAIRDRSARRLLVVGVLGIVVYPLAFYSSMHLAGVAMGTVVSLASAPVFAGLIDFLRDKHGGLTARWAGCTATALVGTALLVIGRPAVAGADGSAALGVFLGLAAGLSYAVYTDSSHRLIGRGHGSNATMGALFGLGALCLLPVLVATGGPLLTSAGSIGISAYLAIGPMFAAYLLFGAGLRHVRSSTATTLTLVEPLVATLLAVLVVGERLHPFGWAGLVLLLAGVVALVWPGRAKPEAFRVESRHARWRVGGPGRLRTTRGTRSARR